MCVGGRHICIYKGRERESIYIERVYIMKRKTRATRRRVCERSVCVWEREARCKSPSLFPGSTNCLNILLIVRLPVYHLQLHCITREIWIHTVHCPLSSSFFQPYSSTSRPPNLHGTYCPWRSPYCILEDCPIYSRKLFCFSIFFCRSVTHRSPDLPEDKGDRFV